MTATIPELTNKQVKQSGKRWFTLKELQKKLIEGASLQIGGAAQLLNNKDLIRSLGVDKLTVQKVMEIYSQDYDFFLEEMAKIKDRLKDKNGKLLTVEDDILYEEIGLILNELNITNIAVTSPHMVKISELCYLAGIRLSKEEPSEAMDDLVNKLEVAMLDTSEALNTVGAINAKVHEMTVDASEMTSVTQEITKLAEDIGVEVEPVSPINPESTEPVTDVTVGEVKNGQ